ncbi:unnamed protein product [Staurois parvus]|uniref:Ribosomal protein S18 n=1 Tax=Staurois parvus TaxID=386267 RepID=A0ABN9BNX0_9NEOB|nr:unnamed protein product [Staurois parvus]
MVTYYSDKSIKIIKNNNNKKQRLQTQYRDDQRLRTQYRDDQRLRTQYRR